MAEKKSENKENKTVTKKAKKEKKVKMLEAKKLPKIFKKSYSEKALEKKIYKKIYIKTDLEFIQSLFEEGEDKKGRKIWKTDLSKVYPKAQIKRYKKLAKQIKLNKSGFKTAPFIAVVVFIAAIGISVTLFKNVIVKSAITSAMEKIFNAKTDIAKVDVQIFGASLEVKGLAQASSSDSSKNLFEIEDIKLNFNLTDLLKGKFHAEDLAVTGVALDTDRKTSGALTEAASAAKTEKASAKDSKAAAKAEKQAAKAAEKAEKAAAKSEKKSAAKKDLTANVKNQLASMFQSYNPENLISSVQSELKSPELAQNISSDVQKKVEKWQNVPSEYESSITTLSTNVDSLIKTDWGSAYEPAKIAQITSTITETLKEADSLKSKIEQTSKDIKTDSELIQSYSTQIQTAIKDDLSLVDKKADELKKLFSVSGIQSLMNDAVNQMLYSVLGEYTPYAQKLLKAAKSTNSGKSAKSTKEEKKTSKTHKRSAGRTVYYRKDTVPKLLIERADASGYEYGTDKLLFKANASEISSDQDMRGKPASINADFNVFGASNNAKIVIDSRSSSNAPLVSADYTGKGFPISADAGIFNLDSKALISADLSVSDAGAFAAGGTIDMTLSKMEGMSFEPEVISSLYQNTLSKIKRLTIGFESTYSEEDGLKITIKNPDVLGKQLAEPLSSALTGELNSIIVSAKKEAASLISDKTGIATDKITEFADIEKLLKNQQAEITNLENTLKNQQKNLTKQAENAAKAAAQEAANKAAEEAKRRAEEAAKKAADEAASKAADAVRGMFGF